MTQSLPRHIAIIMDGNGRWAKKRFLPRVAGHKAGVESVHKIVQRCVDKKIEALTLFAFSSENWQRPAQEVDYLMDLFLTILQREIKKIHDRNIQLRIVGERSRFEKKLQEQIEHAETLTSNNTGLKLIVAVNYGGRWDLIQACRRLAVEIEKGSLTAKEITQELFSTQLSLSDLPEPDLFIRTSGEQRISNFFLWELAYTELYFTDVLWPDFNEEELEKALDFFADRERRFGRISEQVKETPHA